MIRRLLLLCATAPTMALCAGAASADPSGFVSVSAGPLQAETDFGGGSTYSQGGYAARGLASGAFAFTPVLGVQGDVVLGLDHLRGEFDDGVDRSSMDVALHGYFRDSERFLIGTFAQLGTDTTAYGFGEETRERTYFGAEAQLYLGDLTLYGQGGLLQVSYPDEPFFDESGWFGSLEVRYFLTPDFRIDAHAGLTELGRDSGIELGSSTLNLGLGAEYRLPNTPVSVFAVFDCFGFEFEPSGDFSMDQQRFLFGAKFAIGEDSLKDRDRNGPSLKPVDSIGISVFPS